VLTVEQAFDQIMQHPASWGDINISLSKALGCVLSEALCADRDFPPFDRVSMDGIAIRFEAFEKGRRQFRIQGTQAAGVPAMRLEGPDDCLEIMTGAIMPQGADAVVRYEDLEINDGVATVQTEDVKSGQNVHLKGTDRQEGEVIVPTGVRLGPAELGIAATVGKASLRVRNQPRIALIATGDELTPIETKPLPHQIRMSNIYALQGLFQAWSIPADLLHIRDEREEVERGLEEALGRYDVLVLSGGVSAGKFDHVPGVLEQLGIPCIFHKVQQRPGKPLWFGAAGGKTVFALPGNPVSSFMCTVRYIQPWLRASLGLPPLSPLVAALTEDFNFKPSLTFFLQVKVNTSAEGQLLATPEAGKGSGDLANLVLADGFLELPLGQSFFPKGSVFPLWLYRNLQDL
jgi:molybdopterin molybdotransferase